MWWKSELNLLVFLVPRLLPVGGPSQACVLCDTPAFVSCWGWCRRCRTLWKLGPFADLVHHREQWYWDGISAATNLDSFAGVKTQQWTQMEDAALDLPYPQWLICSHCRQFWCMLFGGRGGGKRQRNGNFTDSKQLNEQWNILAPCSWIDFITLDMRKQILVAFQCIYLYSYATVCLSRSKHAHYEFWATPEC